MYKYLKQAFPDHLLLYPLKMDRLEFLTLVRAYCDHRPIFYYWQQLVKKMERIPLLTLPIYKISIWYVRKYDIRFEILAFQRAVG